MQPYLIILSFFAGGLLFIGLGYAFSRLLQTQKPNPAKGTFYECGEDPSPASEGRYNFRFFLPAVLFLLFEIEIVLLAPVILAKAFPPEGWALSSWLRLVRWEAVGFVGILLAGFGLALSRGYLSWEKPRIEPPSFQGPVPDFAYEQYNLEQEKRG